MKTITKAAVGLALLGAAGNASAVGLYALGSDQHLYFLNYDGSAITETDKGAFSNFTTDTTVVGLDYRVQDRRLYAVGNAGGVYTVAGNGRLTLINRTSVALEGTQFGVDFNPAADRLRIISNTGQNLRHNVNSGGTTVADTPLNYVTGTPIANITASAYTNNDFNAETGTLLFNIDAGFALGADQLVLQVPPNAGTLTAIGKLGFDVDTVAGMDIRSVIGVNGEVKNTAYAVLTVAGNRALYSINLLDGSPTALGDIVAPVVDITLGTPALPPTP